MTKTVKMVGTRLMVFSFLTLPSISAKAKSVDGYTLLKQHQTMSDVGRFR